MFLTFFRRTADGKKDRTHPQRNDQITEIHRADKGIIKTEFQVKNTNRQVCRCKKCFQDRLDFAFKDAVKCHEIGRNSQKPA